MIKIINDSGLCYQLHTYLKAQQLIAEGDVKSVLDIGCGNAGKLYAFIYPMVEDITGVDSEAVLVKTEKPFGTWIAADLNKPLQLNRKADLIICADCIEHILFTDIFLGSIRALAAGKVIFSTPNRLSVVRQSLAHRHMWSEDEFVSVLERYGFEILESYIEIERDAYPEYESTVVICKVAT